ncbi:hypothetical protein [Heyndrickxia acidicola]|uniref:Uncharacterized protein n=1 Tax=Heyndrickxia acidicola TaxID=209389 RepID=A0ABU6MJ03_9BACI|nr:hypothetical protein [Heyndrickxia acidicola]MED1204638.1 hypothetical protein [Heyndrickxia acidicola]
MNSRADKASPWRPFPLEDAFFMKVLLKLNVDFYTHIDWSCCRETPD